MNTSLEKKRERERPHEASPTFSLTHHWGYITEQRSEKHAAKINQTEMEML